jgi:hypothetical protein
VGRRHRRGQVRGLRGPDVPRRAGSERHRGAAADFAAQLPLLLGRAAFEQGGDPSNDEERYAVLEGTAPRSLADANPNTGLRDPETFPTAKRKDDYRMCVSAGKNPRDPQDHAFETIEPGDTLGFQAAIVVGGSSKACATTPCRHSLTYDGAYLDCDQDPSTGIDGREAALCPPTTGTYRISLCDSTCDFNPLPACLVTIGEKCEYVNADCDLERQTGVQTGIEGKECLIHWLIAPRRRRRTCA